MPSQGRLNVVLLTVDDLRPDLGAYGVDWARTPSIDRLASSSVAFLQAHATLPNCAPSRASLLTGLRPDEHGVFDLTTHVRDRHAGLTTLPQAFRQAGYLAVSYGKVYHQKLDDAASWSGQDEWADNHTYRGLRGDAWVRAGGWTRGWRYNEYHAPANLARQARMRQARRAGNWSSLAAGINRIMPPFERGPESGHQPASYTDAVLASHAIRAIRRLRQRPRPWFLACGFVRPHLPFVAPARYWDAAGASGAPPPESELDSAAARRGMRRRVLSRLSWAHLRGGDGEV